MPDSKTSSSVNPHASAPKRVGMVTGIHPESIAEYRRLHADGNPGVRDLLHK